MDTAVISQIFKIEAWEINLKSHKPDIYFDHIFDPYDWKLEHEI